MHSESTSSLPNDDSRDGRSAGASGRVAVGHPVDVASGVVFTVAHDFEIPGTFPLLWRRHYATDSAANTILGPRWTTPYLMSLEVRPDGWLLTEESGVAILFARPSTALEVGDRVVNLNANMELWREAAGFVISHWHHGSSDLEIWRFRGSAGKLPVVTIENAAGHVQLIAHDAKGRVAAVVQQIEQRRLQFHYDAAGALESIEMLHPEESPTVLVRYTYEAGMLATATDAMGNITSYGYDPQGRMLWERNALGSAFHFRYDDRGRCVRTSGDGRQLYRELKYHAGGRLVDVKDSLGQVTRYVLNAAGQVLQKVSPSAIATMTEYDALGRTVREINPDGTSRAYEFDDQGNRTAVTFEDGSTIRMRYNDRHALIAVTDALGATTQLERDGRNQLVCIVNALGHRFAASRDARSLVVATDSPLGRRTQRRYGAALDWWEERDDLSLLHRFDFDAFGNTVAYHDAAGLRYSVRYDLCNQPLEERDALGHTWKLSYNALGEVTERTHPNGFVERFEYDTHGQFVGHVTPLGEMSLSYDTEGRLIEVVNRKNERYARGYDADGRIVWERFFDGREQRYEWNSRHQIVRIEQPDGNEVFYTYGPVGDVESISSPRGIDHTYRYDARGYLVEAAAPGSTIEFAFDDAGRLVREAQNRHVIESEYDVENRCVRRRLLGRELAFAYDQRGRLVGIDDEAGRVQALQWNALDQPQERSTPQGVVERLGWRRDDRLVAQTVTASGRMLVDRRFAYNTAGSVSAIDDAVRGRTKYLYDMIGRLVSVDCSDGHRERYVYDAIGAITATHRGTRELGANGRTTRDADGTQYAYDAAGALIAARHADGTERAYEYDARGQLRHATLESGQAVEYVFDALWRRCKRKVDDRVTEYLYSGCLVVGESDSVAGDRLFAGIEWRGMAEWRAGERHFLIADVSNAVTEVVDEKGQPKWSGRFEAYGLPVRERGEAAARQRFPGQWSDEVIGLADNFYRTFDPSLACYLTPDPIGLEGGADHYGYPRNPAIWFDPFGLKCAAHDAEDNMDKHFDKDYEKIGPKPPKNLNTPGIDGVYRARPGKGPPQYIIGEAKSGKAGRLGQTIHSEQQMSDKWVNTGVGGSATDRLQAAVGASEAQNIRTSGSVEKKVFHQPGGTGTPTITTQPYSPTGSGAKF